MTPQPNAAETVRPDTLRQMLYEAEQKAQDIGAKLVKSERQRADQANKMAAHADTMQVLTSLRTLAMEQGEGVLMYVRREDDPTPYPIVIGKAELHAVEPEDWWSTLIDPRAQAVLDAADRAKSWIPADPAADARMREDYEAARTVLQVDAGDLLCSAASSLDEVGEAALVEIRSLRASGGAAKSKITELEARVGELQAELSLLREPEDEDVEVDLVADILGKHGAPRAKPKPVSEGAPVANAAGPSYAPIEVEEPEADEAEAARELVARLEAGGEAPTAEELEVLQGEDAIAELEKIAKESEDAERAESKRRIAAKRKKRSKKKAAKKPNAKLEDFAVTEEVEYDDGLGPDEPGDNREGTGRRGGKLSRGNVIRDIDGTVRPNDPNAHQGR